MRDSLIPIAKVCSRIVGWFSGQVVYRELIVCGWILKRAARCIPKTIQEMILDGETIRSHYLLGRQLEALVNPSFRILLKRNLCQMYSPAVDRESYYWNKHLTEELVKAMYGV